MNGICFLHPTWQNDYNDNFDFIFRTEFELLWITLSMRSLSTLCQNSRQSFNVSIDFSNNTIEQIELIRQNSTETVKVI